MGEKLVLYRLCIIKEQLEVAISELNCGLALTSEEIKECSILAVRKQLAGKLGAERIDELVEAFEKI